MWKLKDQFCIFAKKKKKMQNDTYPLLSFLIVILLNIEYNFYLFIQIIIIIIIINAIDIALLSTIYYSELRQFWFYTYFFFLYW